MRKNVPEELFEEDPFLCSDCKKLGYCRRRALAFKHDYPKVNTVNTALLPPTPSTPSPAIGFSDREIRFWVPMRTEKLPSIGGDLLQKAHTLFHEEEYEQASYIYRDLLVSRNDYNEAWIGLSAALYFMGAYEEATLAASRITAGEQVVACGRFLKSCEKRMRGEEVSKMEVGHTNTLKESNNQMQEEIVG